MPELREDIKSDLQSLISQPLRQASLSLLATLGYRSDRTLELEGSKPQAFLDLVQSQGGSKFDPEKACFSDWKSADILFQLTDEDLAASSSLFKETDIKSGLLRSYLFFTIELKGGDHSRSKLSAIARQINRVFPMPVMVLLKHDRCLSIAVINRRQNKLHADKDVLEKVTLIRDISLIAPHRGHLEILQSIAFSELEHPKKLPIRDFDTLHAAWEQIFNIELLNNRFYKELSNWYFWAVDQVNFPDDLEKDDDKRRATGLIRLLTRLIFCWFLKEKDGLIPSKLFDKEELEKILKGFDPESETSSTYYLAILQNLFFATLNQRMNASGKTYRVFAKDEGFLKNKSTYDVNNLYRYENLFAVPEEEALALFADIPFLNGGLFECLDRTEDGTDKKIYLDGFSRNPKKRPHVPDRLFFDSGETADLSAAYGDKKRKSEKVTGLISILNRYKFTIVENTPIDQEIALDPELLGKVFENLLASYNEETKSTARKQTGSFYTPRPIVEYMVDESLKAHLERKLVEGGAHAPSRVVSDAPVGNCSASPQDSHPPTEASQSSARAPKTAREARALPIRERLDHLFAYTEDVPDFSELEKATLITAIDEVKILDPACGSGAFPMGVLHKLVYILGKLDPDNERWKKTQLAKLDSAPMREALEATFEDNNDDYGRKLYLIENCLYGVDIQPIAIQITKLRFFISLVCDQKTNRNKKENHGIRPLPNLETKFVAADALIGLPIPEPDLFLKSLIEPIEKEIETAYHGHFTIQRRDQKLALQRKIKTLRQKLTDTLLDGLGANKGSEVAKKAQHLADWDPFDPQSKADFFDPHWMFGRSLKDGFDVVIGNPPYVLLQNTQLNPSYQSSLMKQYVAAQYKVDLYHLFIEAGIMALSDEGVLTYITPNTFLKNKHTNRLRELMVTKTKIKSVVLFYRRVFEDPSVDNLIFLCQKTQSYRAAMANTISVSDIRDGELEEQLQTCRPFFQANVKPPDFSFELDITKDAADLLAKIEQETALFGEIGGSYFGIQTFDRNTFVSTEKRSSSYRSVIDGGNVFRFYTMPPTEFVDFRPETIKSGGDPKIYCKDRIVVRQIGKYPEGALCPRGLVTLNTIYNLYLNDDGFDLRFVLAIINSRVIRYYWLCRFYDNKETFPKIKKAPLHSIPIKRCDLVKQEVFTTIVDRILAAKQVNPAADTSALEREIDQQVYALYGLTPEEIAIVEGAAP